MSGGSYDYAYGRVNDVADSIASRLRDDEREARRDTAPTAQVYDSTARRWLTPEESAPVLAAVAEERAWLVGLLRLVADAMHDVEWVDSCDYGPGDEVSAIRAVREYAKGGSP